MQCCVFYLPPPLMGEGWGEGVQLAESCALANASAPSPARGEGG